MQVALSCRFSLFRSCSHSKAYFKASVRTQVTCSWLRWLTTEGQIKSDTFSPGQQIKQAETAQQCSAWKMTKSCGHTQSDAAWRHMVTLASCRPGYPCLATLASSGAMQALLQCCPTVVTSLSLQRQGLHLCRCMYKATLRLHDTVNVTSHSPCHYISTSRVNKMPNP